MAAYPKPPDFRKHVMVHPMIEVDGDRATVEAYWLLLERSADGQPVLSAFGQYHDRLVKQEGRWRIAERCAEVELRFCGSLGPVLLSDSGEMSKDTPIGLAGVPVCFHADYGYSPEPLQAISLHAIDVVDGETSTRFASTPCRSSAPGSTVATGEPTSTRGCPTPPTPSCNRLRTASATSTPRR